MEARCYRGGENRTRMKQLSFEFRDGTSLVLMVMMIVGLYLTTLIQIPLVFPI